MSINHKRSQFASNQTRKNKDHHLTKIFKTIHTSQQVGFQAINSDRERSPFGLKPIHQSRNFEFFKKQENGQTKLPTHQIQSSRIDRDETQETFAHDGQSQKGFEEDDSVTISIDGQEHEVDSIVQFKKTTTGIP